MISRPKTILKLSLFLLGLVISTSTQAYKSNLTSPINGQEPTDARIEEGSKLFASNCATCHAIDRKLIGPALSGVLAKYDDVDYVIDWIQNNAALISAGDPRAVEASKIDASAMNLFTNLSDDQVTSILMYIENGGDGDEPVAAEGGAAAPAEPVDESLFGKVNWGIVILSVLMFVILVLIVGIIELVSNITGRQIINWNNVNAFMMIVFVFIFFALVLYEYSVHKQFLLPEASSEHGIELDRMMKWTFMATIPVFFITQFLLFYFSFRYRHREGRKAYYYPHNNNLEYIWTTVPAVVLTILVLGGLKSWKNIVKSDPPANTTEIEVFAYQFGWQARYAGEDGKLGQADFNLISATNPLGVANLEYAKGLLVELEEEIKKIEERIAGLGKEEAKLRSTLGGLVGEERKKHLKEIESYASGEVRDDLELTIRARKTQIDRIKRSIEAAETADFYNGYGNDDQVVQEIHLVIGKPVTLRFRARDVIHSAYLPYFRAQMNVVPGLPTQFTFTPTKTTNEMRRLKSDPEWDYYLVCNKICGNAHFNMKLKVVVEQQSDYDKWLAEQGALFVKAEPEAPTEEATEATETEETETETENQTEEGLALN